MYAFDEAGQISSMHRHSHAEPDMNHAAEPAPVTIRISPRTQARLDAVKESPDESYDAVISRLCDRMGDKEPLSEETLREIERSLAELRKGISHTHDEIVQELVAGKKE